jgi:hypothetical protein
MLEKEGIREITGPSLCRPDKKPHLGVGEKRFIL